VEHLLLAPFVVRLVVPGRYCPPDRVGTQAVLDLEELLTHLGPLALAVLLPVVN
jgi:hypothetical protein